MAIQGLIGTGNFVTDERPKNWRQGILMRFPNGHAPLVALTSAMKKRVTDDPEFNWWEREISNVRLQLTADAGTGTTLTVALDPFGFTGNDQLKAGDLLYMEETGEIMRVTNPNPTTTTITVTRSYGTVAATDVTVASENPNMVIMGSAFEEGASTPESIRYRPSKVVNYTQIFRDSLKATRTAMQTRLRTVDEVRDAKTEALLYHSIRQEYGFILGNPTEVTGTDGQPERMTGGIIHFIPAANRIAQAGAATTWEDMEGWLLEAFRFGSQEKMAFVGNRAMLAIQQMVRDASNGGGNLEITPMTKEFGLDVRRLFTPFGTLVLKTHPLFNQIGSTGSPLDVFGFDAWVLIVDMAQLTYRPLRNSDTQYLPDRQGNGVDGLTSEYLTEAGLEIAHGKNHFWISGLVPQ